MLIYIGACSSRHFLSRSSIPRSLQSFGVGGGSKYLVNVQFPGLFHRCWIVALNGDAQELVNESRYVAEAKTVENRIATTTATLTQARFFEACGIVKASESKRKRLQY